MVDLEKGAPIRERVRGILARHGWQHEIRHVPKVAASPPGAEGAPRPPGEKKSIWDRLKFWKA